MQNYTIYHLHSMLSLIDSCTRFQDYIDRAKECGMTAMGFSEHGHIYEYYHKKMAIEEAGMKYIHAAEVYVTESLDDIKRDNYHCVLISKNLAGFYELNRLISHSFNRAKVKIVGDDERYYYAPRVLFSDILNTTDNIIITTACIAGILSKGSEELQERFLTFLGDNKHRCFLEIQHHDVKAQIEYNQKLYSLHKRTQIPLIAGTDTHALNELHVKGRSMLQKSKGISYDDEVGWDLVFKTYDELVQAYEDQAALPLEVALEAINNTNVMAEMVEPFELDTDTKYPHIYGNPVDTFKQKVNQAYKSHPYIKKRYSIDEIKTTVRDELDTYIKTKSIDFMLLQNYLREWERDHDIACGYGRGSVSGSEIAYILGITQMDSKRFGLNFFRFMNPSRVTNADIDTDYAGTDRDRVKEFLLRDHMGLDQIQCSEIITFNTIALKGAIRDVCRGLYADTDPDYIKTADYICNNVESDEQKMREEYPEVFEYVDILNGTTVSVGSHPSGVLVTDIDLAEKIGLCSLSSSEYPVSMLNMKELDSLMYVKLDILGLDNVGIINETCRLAGIERLTPDNTDLNDEKVWKSIRDDTTCIFQWESSSAASYLRKFMSDDTLEIAKSLNPNFSYIKWFSFGNGLIRPGCASFRDNVANGEVLRTGFKELDQFLFVTMGRITMQEDIMKFLVMFCGYSDAESDTVRRGIAKKYGTEKFIDEIHDRFIQYSSETYGEDKDKLEGIFPPIKQGILDATRYSFSWNHSDSYSCIGYICGYLRYYYPVEFLTAALNIFKDNDEKTLAITTYAKKVNVPIKPVKFRHSQADYSCDSKQGVIYKGLSSIKFMSAQAADDLYSLKDNEYDSFIDLLDDLGALRIDNRQIDILIKIDFFEEFGKINQLLATMEVCSQIRGHKNYKIENLSKLNLTLDDVREYCNKVTDKTLMGIDWKAFVKAALSRKEIKKTTVLDRLRYEHEFLGYNQTIAPGAEEEYYFVQSLIGYSNNIMQLYQVKTGKTIEVRNRSKRKVKEGDLIKILEIANQKKWRKNDNDEWYQIEEREKVATKISFVT